MTTHTLYTWGYQGQTVATLDGLLEEHDALLVDVRYKPWSRLAGWSRNHLTARYGTRYAHVPELGNLHYQSADQVELANPQAGAERVGLLLQQRSVILLCMCPSLNCHRVDAAQVVADYTGAPIVHLPTAETRQRSTGPRRVRPLPF